MTKFECLTQKKFQRGFSLIEVLVALVILVIGLIGIFNLHIVAKRSSFESFQQTQASYYANDIINRMKLNRTQLASYNGDYTGSQTAITPVSPACEGGTLCTPTQLVAWDLYEWRSAFSGEDEIVGTQNVGGLDTPSACIQVTDNDVLVVIAWRGIRKTAIDSSKIVDTSPKCGANKENRRIFSIKTVII
ncbi:type IV pilus modification protein PilV [Shewanella sp. CG12_big_fil_rev_8_21_14_0_65_47_15]|uniref:type IV pilus modification protein PilV n=1 Tax=Shewanella sp. CG12_big_fil_rev_8_21_14_0_65_47_15 TaxID=1975537 RepID=UPI0025ED7D18|nr:type IV pilus modification protein PilV [Shewanella sp. CG12_big_fil_rev_8_21_14_0_65_47_15]